MSDSIIIDPELAEPAPKPVSTEGKRFFIADDGSDCDYTIVARDLEHAKQILRDFGVEFCDEDGWSHPIDHPKVAHATWTEVSAERAATIMCWSEAGHGEHKPLTEYAIGEFFSSEF